VFIININACTTRKRTVRQFHAVGLLSVVVQDNS
jgi:hypothetical protein